MKKSELRQIIREEIQNLLIESNLDKVKKVLKQAKIPYSFKKNRIGIKDLFIKGNLDDAKNKLKDLGWEREKRDVSISSSGGTTYTFKKGNEEISIFASGYDDPQVSLK